MYVLILEDQLNPGLYVMLIKLCPLGAISSDLLTTLSEQLATIFPWETEVCASQSIPQNSYNQERRQYSATKILIDFNKRDSARESIRLALIDCDLYAEGLNFVFGHADSRRQCAIVALPRLRQTFYGLEANYPLFSGRCLKECVHEIGHLLGLGHCNQPSCGMYFSNSLSDTDHKSEIFCARCQSLIGTADR